MNDPVEQPDSVHSLIRSSRNHWRLWHRRSASPPVLVFVDDGPWISFNQMAARMRRSGCEVLRITCDGSLRSRLPNYLIYNQSYIVRSWDELPKLDDLVRFGHVVDVQCPEQLLHVAEHLVHDSNIVSFGALDRLRQRVFFGDKLIAMDCLREGGVRVPSHFDADTVTIDAAVDSLSLPLVIKPRRGSSGRGAVIARDIELARQADANFPENSALYEEFIDGQQLAFCAVYRDGLVVQEAVFERLRYDAQSLAPSDSLVTLDDEMLFALGRKVVAVIGGSGLVECDVLRDAAGNDYVIDVNLRAWGSIGAFLRAGVDFTAGYLSVIGVVASSQASNRAAPGINLSFSLFRRIDKQIEPKTLSGMFWFVVASFHRVHDFGLRYWLNGLLIHVFGGFRERRPVKAE